MSKSNKLTIAGKKIVIPAELVTPEELKGVSNLHGIQETGEMLLFLFEGIEVYEEANADGKIDFSDIFLLKKLINPGIAAVKGIEKIPAELTDEITETELKILQEIIRQSSVNNKWVDKVEKALIALWLLKQVIFE